MAASASSSSSRAQPSRLQRQKPPSLQINPPSSWNVAIPLLSPLITSPPAIDHDRHRTAEIKSREAHQHQKNHGAESEKKVGSANKWQQPPLCYEPSVAPLAPSFFVPV